MAAVCMGTAGMVSSVLKRRSAAAEMGLQDGTVGSADFQQDVRLVQQCRMYMLTAMRWLTVCHWYQSAAMQLASYRYLELPIPR